MAWREEGQKGSLVDIDTGLVRRDRMLVQSGRGAVVFLGFGRRAAQLDRFAFSDENDPDPFFARCRAIADLIESGGVEKATRLGMPPEILAIEDKALRRLAVAEALAKSGYNPDQPRAPAGSPGGGQWTSGDVGAHGGAGADGATPRSEAADQNIEPAAAQTGATPAIKDAFVEAHLADAQKAADELGVPVENALGLSALESGWGEGNRFVTEGHNFFGIHYPAPHANGFMYAGDGKTRVATFEDYEAGLQSFIQTAGSIVHGKSDPTEFATVLHSSGKFGATNPNYVDKLSQTIRGLRPYIARHRS